MNASPLSKTAEIALISSIAASVLFFGGTEPASFAAVEIVLFATTAWIMVKRGASVTLRPVYLAVPLFLAVWGLLQFLPMLRLIGENRGGNGAPVVWSLAPYQTRAEFLIVLACCAGFFLALFVCGERERKRRLVHALVLLGAGEAFYGLVQYLANWQTIWWYSKKYDLEEATGTYINRNHFAGLLEMILPFAVCLALYEGEKFIFDRAHRVRHSRGAGTTSSSVLLWLGAGVVLMAGLVFSRSRMGLLAAVASLIVIFSLNLLQRRMAPVAIGFAFVLLSLSFAAWIGLRPAITRFEGLGGELSGQQETRLSIWPGALKLIGEHPLAGTGLGTFPVVYTRYQTSFLTKFVNHAHNDYLEIAGDLGIPAAVILFGSIVWVLIRCMRNVYDSASRFERNVALACVGSIVAILLHSLTDFNLYIPANALSFAVILGIALASNGDRRRIEAGT